MGRARSRRRRKSGPQAAGCVLALGALLACSCGPSRPDRTTAPIYTGGDENGGGRARAASADIDDDDEVKTLFFQVSGAARIRTCAPAAAPWAILTYAPEVLDEHRVKTREIQCQEKVISERCSFVGEVRYYLDDPKEYFSVGKGVKPERALQIAELSRELSSDGRLMAISADKGGVYLVTMGDCGRETQLAVRVKGAAAQRRLEVVETRYHVEL